MPHQFDIFDDFHWYLSPHLWTSLAADGGITAPVISDAAGGVITMSTGATDNNEVGVNSTAELFKFAADGSFTFESRIKFAEAATDDANVAVGLADAAGANLLGNDGAGDAINSSGVLIFKVDGETTWRCAVEINGTVKESVSDQTAGGSSYQRLRIEGEAVDGTNMEITYFLNDAPLTDSTFHRPIMHRIAYASATEMKLVAGYLKAGDAASETLLIDYCGFSAVRL